LSREVFQTNKYIVIGIVSAIFIGITIFYFQVDFPILVLPIVAVIGLLVIISTIKTKVVIENGFLRYEKIGRGEEVDLKKVGQIVTREVETIVDRKTDRTDRTSQNSGFSKGKFGINNHHNVDQERKIEKVVYVIDKEGRTFFSFPGNLIGFRQRTRFREAVQAVNPQIEVF